MVKANKLTVDTISALSAAILAFQDNDQTILRHSNTQLEPGQIENKQRMFDYLTAELPVADSLRDEAENIRDSIGRRVMMNTLVGANNNDFLLQVNQLLQQNTVTNRDFGIIAWAPKLYADVERSETEREQILRLGANSEFIGQLTKKVAFNFNVISCRYLREYDSFVHIGHDDTGNLVQFWNKKKIATNSSITARVKNQRRDERYSNSKITFLNYAKVVNEE
jgi:hypothetical protein